MPPQTNTYGHRNAKIYKERKHDQRHTPDTVYVNIGDCIANPVFRYIQKTKKQADKSCKYKRQQGQLQRFPHGAQQEYPIFPD